MTTAELARPDLLVDVERIKALLRAYLEDQEPGVAGPARADSPLDRVVSRLALTAFERDLLLLAASVELDGEAAALVGQALGTGDSRPTYALAMAALPGAHWDALTPERPLRHWGLVELEDRGALATRPLRIDEHLLHTLAGLVDDAATLDGLALAPRTAGVLTPSQEAVADELARCIAALSGPVLVRLDGDDRDAQLAVAGRLATGLGLTVLPVRDAVLADRDLAHAARVLDREALVADRLVLTSHPRLLELLDSPVVVSIGDDLTVEGRTLVARSIDFPRGVEQVDLWVDAMAPELTDDAGSGRGGPRGGPPLPARRAEHRGDRRRVVGTADRHARRPAPARPRTGAGEPRLPGRAHRADAHAGTTWCCPTASSRCSTTLPGRCATAARCTTSGGSPRTRVAGWA